LSLKIYRIYRKDIEDLPWYSNEYMTKECIVVARSSVIAKGIVLEKYDLADTNYSKKNILVEELTLKEGMILGSR